MDSAENTSTIGVIPMFVILLFPLNLALSTHKLGAFNNLNSDNPLN